MLKLARRVGCGKACRQGRRDCRNGRVKLAGWEVKFARREVNLAEWEVKLFSGLRVFPGQIGCENSS